MQFLVEKSSDYFYRSPLEEFGFAKKKIFRKDRGIRICQNIVFPSIFDSLTEKNILLPQQVFGFFP